MISTETQLKMVKIFLTLSEGENSIETTRQLLSNNYEYDPFQIFKHLDLCFKNKIDAHDILSFLISKNIIVNEKEVNLLILFYDINGDGNLSYFEFLNIIQSNNSFKSNKSFSKNYYQLPFNIEYYLLKILEKEIQLSRNILNLLSQIKSRYDFNIHEIFHLIKGLNNNTSDGIKNFLEKNNENCFETRINNIIKRLDLNKDGKIDLGEFHTILGYPECSKCCPLNSCFICNCKMCNFCFSDVYCNFHNCFHKNFPLIYSPLSSPKQKFVNSPKIRYWKSNPNSPVRCNKYNFEERKEKILKEENLENMKNLNNDSIQYNITNQSLLRENSQRNNNIKKSPSKKNYILNRNCKTPEQKVVPSLSLTLSPKRNNLSLDSHNHEKENNSFNKDNNNDNIFGSNAYEKYQFNNYLKELMNAENKIENIKIELSLKCDFNPEDTFRIFEFNEKGILTKECLNMGFNLLNINVNDSDIRLFLNRFDLNKKGYLNFKDFFDIVVPFEKDYRNNVENRFSNSCCKCKFFEVFSFSTTNTLKNLFEMIIDFENKLNCMKKDYNTLRLKFKNLFNLIDKSNSGHINNDELNYYLKKNSLFRNIKESNLLYIRLDKNRDGKIDINEFEDEFQIKC